MCILFLIGSAVGFQVALSSEAVQDYFITTFIPDFIGDLATATNFELLVYIALNNMRVAALMVVVGAILFFVPGIIIFINGFIIGVLGFIVAKTLDIETFFIGILPHGVLELAAVFLAAAVGTRLGVQAVRVLRRKLPIKDWLRLFSRGVIAFVCILVPALALAAVIEVYVTPLFL